MMEKFRSLSFSTRTFVVASGVVITSIGAYLLYEKLKRQRRDSKNKGTDDRMACTRQPCENTDDSGTYSQSQGKKVLVLGLEKSGKSCLLAAMSNEDTRKPYQPTRGFNVVCLTNIGARLDIMEVGGSHGYREHWSKFLIDTSILLFVIDSCEKEELPSALDALKGLLTNDTVGNVPVVIVFSKRDCSTAIPIQELISIIRGEQIGDKIYKYLGIQVRCGGAQKTYGVAQLQEILVELARSP